MSCVGDKSLGQDGFSIAFFQACWHIIKPYLMVVLHNFYENGEFDVV